MRGITYNKGQESHNGIGIKVLRANNITLDYNTLNFDDIKIVDKNVKVKDEQYLEKNDILICAGSGSKDHIGKVAYIKENIDYTFGGFMGVIRVTEECNSRFMFYILTGGAFKKYLEATLNSSTINNLNSQVMNNFFLPVPPLETQKRIVSILDKFEMLANSLSDGLPAEIEARKKQYEYYRDKLLDFKDAGGGYYLLEKIVQWLPLGEIATEMYRGAGIKRDEVTEEGMPCVRYGEIYTTYDIWFDECVSHTDEDKIPSKKYFENGDILFAITGESVEEIAKSCAYVGNEKCLAGGDIVVMKHRQNPKYLAYALSTTDAQRQKSKGKIKSKVVHASVPSISSIVIPLPPLAIQGWIAEILDKFHSLSTDISEGIPAEIEARKKQYEYYRDKLLAFKKLENVV